MGIGQLFHHTLLTFAFCSAFAARIGYSPVVLLDEHGRIDSPLAVDDFQLVIQGSNGNLVLQQISTGQALWASGSADDTDASYYGVFQSDCNLIVFREPGGEHNLLWKSGRRPDVECYLAILPLEERIGIYYDDDSGRMQVHWEESLFATPSMTQEHQGHVIVLPRRTPIPVGQSFEAGDYQFELQVDGSFALSVLSSGEKIWESAERGSPTGNYVGNFQGDCNLISFRLPGFAPQYDLWKSGTSTHADPDCFLAVNEGRTDIIIYRGTEDNVMDILWEQSLDRPLPSPLITDSPTLGPSVYPSPLPSKQRSIAPSASAEASISPSIVSSKAPIVPSEEENLNPTVFPSTKSPSDEPSSLAPTDIPSSPPFTHFPTQSPSFLPTASPTNTVIAGVFLLSDQPFLATDDDICRQSPTGLSSFCLSMRDDGNLVLYAVDPYELLWESGVSAGGDLFWTILQRDGNLVTRQGFFSVWSAQSVVDNHQQFQLRINDQETGLVIVASTTPDNPIWSSAGDVGDGTFPWVPAPLSQDHSVASGPLVGHSTETTVKLWAYQGNNEVMQVVYRRAGSSTASSRDMVPNEVGASFVVVDGLSPNTRYEYELRIEGERVAEGQWKTAIPFGPGEFQYLLASCMDARTHTQQPVWNRVLEEAPDFAILNGDTVYLNGADWTSRGEIILSRVWARNLEQRAETNFINFISRVPMYSTWDDHEYGMNNAHHTQLGKENSLNAFKNLWANPYAGTPAVPGVHYDFYHGDVHFIVMDDRWYRNPATDTQFGPAQLNWLYDKLEYSRGVFKVIVSGADVMERNFAADVRAIGRFVAEKSISGVLFNAGDVHRNEFKTQNVGAWPYPVTQITSSGIARVWRRPFAIVKVNTRLADPEIRVHFFGANDMRIDTTWTNLPDYPCGDVEATDRTMQHRCTQIIRLSHLIPT